MKVFEKIQTFIILCAVILGLALSHFQVIEVYAERLIVPCLFVMLYGLFLAVPMDDFKKSFLNNSFMRANVVINFLWTPLLAWALGALFLSNHPALWIGFVMLLITPCTDWVLAFTGIAKGNLALSTSVLPLNLILQVLLLPVYLFLFAGVVGTVQMSLMLKSLMLVVVLPFMFANGTRFLFNKLGKQRWLNLRLIPFFNVGQIVFLSLAIMAMFASQGSELFSNLNIVLILLTPVLLFFVINFFVGKFTCRLAKFNYEDSVSLHLTTLARNSPIALAIAVIAFPDQPLISLALVIGPLIELPILAIISQLLLKLRRSV